MTVEKPKPKQLLRPITTGAGSAMNQSQFLASTCNSLEARERSRIHGSIGFGFASHCLKNWRESFKPITKRSNRNHGITFDSHLKTALLLQITGSLNLNMDPQDIHSKGELSHFRELGASCLLCIWLLSLRYILRAMIYHLCDSSNRFYHQSCNYTTW